VTSNHSSTNNRKIIYLSADMLRRDTNTVHSQESTEMTINESMTHAQEAHEFYRLLQNELPGTSESLGSLITKVDELDWQMIDLTNQLTDVMSVIGQQNGQTICVSDSELRDEEPQPITAASKGELATAQAAGLDTSAVQQMAREELAGTRQALSTLESIVDVLNVQMKALTMMVNGLISEMPRA
jgi:hypothetical protein